MDLSTALKLATVSGVSVALWLVALNRHIPPGWRGFAFTLSSLSALTFLAEASKLSRLAPWEESARKLQHELWMQDMAYQHLAQQDALRNQYFQPQPQWQQPISAEHHPLPQPRQIPPDDDESGVEVTDSTPQTEAIATLPTTDIPRFNFAAITDPDGCPCVAVIGNPGSGKSVLTTWLISNYFPGSRVTVYDTDCKPDEWRGLRVIGRRGDYRAIGEAMVDDLELLAHRTQLRGSGREVGGEEVRVVEEFPTLAADLEPGDRRATNPAAEWLRRMVRRGRKYRFKLFLVSQSWSVKGLRIEGEGDLRMSFTIFFLGSHAFEALKHESNPRRRDQLRDCLKQQNRPALVIHQGQIYTAEIPDLTANSPLIPDNRSDFWNPENHLQKPQNQSFQRSFQSFQHPEIAEIPETVLKRLETLLEATPSLSEMAEMKSEMAETADFRGDAEILKRISALKKQGLTQTEIIRKIWGVEPGATKGYQQAVKTYKRLTGEA